jgi:hypothetical protein
LHARNLDRAEPLSNELDSLWRRGLFNAEWMKRSRKIASVSDPPRAADDGGVAVSRIRETEDARALLQDQLHSLYWWIFNACRIRGFIRAKRLDEMDSVPREPSAAPDEQPALLEHDQSQ